WGACGRFRRDYRGDGGAVRAPGRRGRWNRPRLPQARAGRSLSAREVVFHGWTPSRNAENGVGTRAMASGFSFVGTRAAPTVVVMTNDSRSAFQLNNSDKTFRDQGSSAHRLDRSSRVSHECRRDPFRPARLAALAVVPSTCRDVHGTAGRP